MARILLHPALNTTQGLSKETAPLESLTNSTKTKLKRQLCASVTKQVTTSVPVRPLTNYVRISERFRRRKLRRLRLRRKLRSRRKL